jgi:hypothetical protein
MVAPKITLDTNCIINLRDPDGETSTSVEQIHEIIRASHRNSIELAITTRVEADVGRDRDEARRLATLQMLGQFPVIGSLFRFDTSDWDNGDLWAKEEDRQLAEEVGRLLFPGLISSDKRYSNKVNDIDHLVSHRINRRDVFVTDDRRMLSRSTELKNGFSIVVMSPQQCVDFIQRIDVPRHEFELRADDPQYHSVSLSGVVTFDYSNNDGGFCIGDGLWLFNTKWTKASDTSIYAYRDGKGMEAIGLAKDITDLATPPIYSSYDFSSRVRMPNIGQTVIWRNVNAQYAVTKILGIKDDKRGAEADELTFQYQIFVG